jgi:L-aminopeptidase/D-esterase-like protein
MILGVPVGRHILDEQLRGKEQGSIIAIVTTDAPLQAHQLKRLARRVSLGLARTGTSGGNGSGDIFLAFSTANAEAMSSRSIRRTADYLGFPAMDPLFQAVVECTEEAVIDAMITAETMVGRDGNRSVALPHDRLMSIMRQYGRA